MTTESFRAEEGRPERSDEGARGGKRGGARGLLDVLGVAAVVLDAEGRILFWSPQAEELFGYRAAEALGRYAGQLLVPEEHLELVARLFSEVLESGESWAGAFPVLHKDGTTRLVEFRNMRLTDGLGDVFALGIAADHATVQRVETDLALSERLVSQSPIGLALMDTDLRYVLVNPALERIDRIPAAEHLGRHVRDTLPVRDVDAVEAALRRVLATGTPLVDRYVLGRHALGPDRPSGPAGSAGPAQQAEQADPEDVRAWSLSCYRLEGHQGRILGVAISVIDVTERHRAATEADRARRRLGLIADASARVGTTLEVGQTAHELAAVAVPELADVAAVDVLDSVLSCRRPGAPDSGPELFRALAVKAGHPTAAVAAADPTGEPAMYGADRLVTRCVHTGLPVMVAEVTEADLPAIARNERAVELLAQAGLHSYLAVPLIARGEVLGALDLKRTRNPLPFDEDDVILASELAARAAVSIDNARWYQSVRNSAVTLQRSLLPGNPPSPVGLEVASRYQPAHASMEVGGDWYDVIPLAGEKTALVVGDVMGSGIDAAATMGRLRTATCAFADLDLDPAEVLRHLDKITAGLEHYIATCLYCVYDPRTGQCLISNAGHLPPALLRASGGPAELVRVPTGAPLGVGGVAFETVTVPLGPGDLLVLYTDGLVETRNDPIDRRLDALLALLDDPRRPLEETCTVLLRALRRSDDFDDVALLVARSLP
ncbi:SpoIIE family protein phosphatase [Streptomyces sp. WAC06614]|uniref:SpoIIE family protein phosphatase n=1 Tax=Streptomyces sp. WAC06614 TaxID=2487416 RepID=UPI0021AF29DD|nr:SpoIIE family protein phosphatase [Streptomyces sp. WAC06614]